MRITSTFRKELKLLLALLGVSFVISAVLFRVYEMGQGRIQSWIDIVWWWVVTSSTVGYGDLVPTTLGGRVAGVIAIIIGIYAYTHVITLILRLVQYNFEKDERGYAEIESSGHVLICEYTAFADELIQEIKKNGLFANRDIVIVGSLIERAPYPEYQFVQGQPISPDTLERANAAAADYIFVFSNNRFTDPDTKTLHVVSRIMDINDHAEIIVELNDEENELLDYLPRPVISMKTDDLLSSSLSHKHVQLDKYLEGI